MKVILILFIGLVLTLKAYSSEGLNQPIEDFIKEGQNLAPQQSRKPSSLVQEIIFPDTAQYKSCQVKAEISAMDIRLVYRKIEVSCDGLNLITYSAWNISSEFQKIRDFETDWIHHLKAKKFDWTFKEEGDRSVSWVRVSSLKKRLPI